MKFIWIILLALIAWRLLSGRWPWQPSNRALRAQTRAQARNLLGVSPGASRAEIIDAHRRLLAAVHPDRGGSNEAVHEANAARDTLLAEPPPRSQEHL